MILAMNDIANAAFGWFVTVFAVCGSALVVAGTAWVLTAYWRHWPR